MAKMIVDEMNCVEKCDVVIEFAKEHGRNDIVDFIADRRAKVVKRNNTSRVLAKDKTENVELRNKVYDFLYESGCGKTVTEINTTCSSLSGLSNSKITNLLCQLMEEGRVTKVYDKKTPRFSAVV